MIVLAIGFGCCIGKVVTLKYKIPWNADVSMISMAFIYVGWFIRQFLLKQLTGLTGWKALLIVGFLLLVLSITYCLNLPISEYGTAYVAMAFSTYGNIIWFYINALIGSLAVIIFSFSFSIPILQSIGRRTLTILVIHSRVRSLLNFMIEKIGLSELYFKFEWLIVVFVVILISIPIDFLLRRYAPNLVGR